MHSTAAALSLEGHGERTSVIIAGMLKMAQRLYIACYTFGTRLLDGDSTFELELILHKEPFPYYDGGHCCVMCYSI